MLLRIDVATGGTVLDAVDLRQPGLIPFVFGRRYESARTGAGAFGPRWRSGFDLSLEATDEGVTVRGGLLDGVVFEPVAPGREARLADRGLTLQHHPEAYVLFESARRQWVFPHGGRTGTFRPASIRDAAGNLLRLDHRGARLAAIVDPEGRRFRFTWTGDRLASVEREATGKNLVVRAYDYDVRGDLVSVTDALGRSTRYAYDTGLMVGVVHATGGRQYASYDAERRCAALWDDGGSIMYARYDPARLATRAWDRDGQQTLYRYADAAQVLERIAASGASQSFYYDEAQRLIGHALDLGETRTFQRLDPGAMELVHLEAGEQVAFVQYDEGGRALALRDAAERALTLERGAAGEIVALLDGAAARWAFERDRQGRVTAITSPEGRRVMVRWARQQRQVEGPAGVICRDSLDDAGRLILTTDALGRERRLHYDPEGQLVRATCGGYGVEFIYDRAGRLLGSLDTERRRYRLARDVHGRATDVEVDGRRLVVRHDAAGRLLGAAEGDARRVIARYDAFSRLAQIDGPAGPVVTYAYDDAGQATAHGIGGEVRFSRGGAPLAVTRDGQVDAFTYGASGELLVWEHGGAGGTTTIFDYDACARLARVSWVGEEPDPRLATLDYDRDGLLARLAIDDRTWDVRRGASGQPEAFVAGDAEVVCTLDAAGRPVALAGPGATVEVRYDDLDRVPGVRAVDGDGQEQRFDLRQPGTEARVALGPGLVLVAVLRGVIVAAEAQGDLWPLWQQGEVRADTLDASRAAVVARVAGWQAVLRPPDVHGAAALARWSRRRWDEDATAVPAARELGLRWPLLDSELLDPGVVDAYHGRQPGALPEHQEDDARSPYALLSGTHRSGRLRPAPWRTRSVGALLAPAGVPSPRSFGLDAALALLIR